MECVVKVGKTSAKNHVYPRIILPETWQSLVGKLVTLTFANGRQEGTDLGNVAQSREFANSRTGGARVVKQSKTQHLECCPAGVQECKSPPSHSMTKKKFVKKVVWRHPKYENLPAGELPPYAYSPAPARTDTLAFTRADVDAFIEQKQRKGIYIVTLRTHLYMFLASTGGIISKDTLDKARDDALLKYTTFSSLKKYRNYTREFVKHKMRSDFDNAELWAKYLSYYDVPTPAARRGMTERTVTLEDIQEVVRQIPDTHTRAYVILGYYTGQRVASLAKLTRKQIEDGIAVGSIRMEADQDKVKTAHWIPLHPIVKKELKKLLKEEKFDPPFSWKRANLQIRRLKATISSGQSFMLSDTRKGFEQQSDALKMDSRYVQYIMTHGISSVQWRHYKQFSPSTIYREYIKAWEGVVVK